MLLDRVLPTNRSLELLRGLRRRKDNQSGTAMKGVLGMRCECKGRKLEAGRSIMMKYRVVHSIIIMT